MKDRIGTICMLLGAVLLLAALSLFLWNRNEDAQAKKSVAQVLPKLIEQLETSDDVGQDGELSYPDPYDPMMAEVEIDGYDYIGYLSVPSLGLELPIMSEWDYNRLKIAPCRYSGSTKTNDLVLAAHNYTWHFGPIKELAIGDEVYFTDMDDVVTCYEVAAMETLSPVAVEEMSAGDWDLTLFTCTYSGQSRVAVRCDRVNK